MCIRDRVCEGAILTPKNDRVNNINIRIQDRLPGCATTYKSTDTGCVQRVQRASCVLSTEFLNSLEPPGMQPHILTLKVGTPIILLRNIDPPKMCNGTRLCVKTLMPNVIKATIITGYAKGDVFISCRPIPLIPSDMPSDFKRLQFPIRLAFVMKINKG